MKKLNFLVLHAYAVAIHGYPALMMFVNALIAKQLDTISPKKRMNKNC